MYEEEGRKWGGGSVRERDVKCFTASFKCKTFYICVLGLPLTENVSRLAKILQQNKHGKMPLTENVSRLAKILQQNKQGKMLKRFSVKHFTAKQTEP